jgi:hypothetical protein
MTDRNLEMANELRKLADAWVSSRFNYIPLAVAQKMASSESESSLTEYIEGPEITQEDLENFDLLEGYKTDVLSELEEGEDPDDCAVRELEEETGFKAGRLEKLGSIRTTPGFSDELIHLYAAHELTAGTQATEDCEILSVERLRFDEALDMIRDGRLTDAKSICGLSLANFRRG